MQLTYFTLRALAREWASEGHEACLVGASIVEAYSVSRGELTLVLAHGEGGISSLRISVQPGQVFAFRQPGAGKPKRNVTPLFKSLQGHQLEAVQVADRDRVLDLVTDNGGRLRVTLFGSRANVYAADPEGDLKEAFREKVAAEELPVPRAAPDPRSAAELADRWPGGAQPVARALSRAAPLLDQWMAKEVAGRADLSSADSCLLESSDFERIAESMTGLIGELEDPRPVLYRDGRAPVALCLIPLTESVGEAEQFDSVDAAVRGWVRAALSERRFRQDYDPLLRLLQSAAVRTRDRHTAMAREISQPSRADQYEKWGHLLMAGAAGNPPGRDKVSLPDLFGSGEEVVIPLDPALGGTENANRLYDRARRSRRARQEAEGRIAAAEREADKAAQLLDELTGIQDWKVLKAFSKQNAVSLSALRGAGSPRQKDEIPFRRYQLEGGYEVWVGRNAKQNDLLTSQYARKHDFWLHARGVGGSHTVLRRTDKTKPPPQAVIEAAASIAAWHSKAKGSALVPVIVTERKYVRKPRKAPLGTVLIDREDVVIVPPSLPNPLDS